MQMRQTRSKFMIHIHTYTIKTRVKPQTHTIKTRVKPHPYTIKTRVNIHNPNTGGEDEQEHSRQDEDGQMERAGEMYPTTALFTTNYESPVIRGQPTHQPPDDKSDPSSSTYNTCKLRTPSWAEQQALKDSWGSHSAGGTANS